MLAVLVLFQLVHNSFSHQCLETNTDGTKGEEGQMFDIYAKKSIKILDIEQRFDDVGEHPVEVYFTTEPVSYVEAQTDPSRWTLIAELTITVHEARTRVPLGLDLDRTLEAGLRQGVYITLTSSEDVSWSLECGGPRDFDNENDDIGITYGVIVDFDETGRFTDPTHKFYRSFFWAWNGMVCYEPLPDSEFIAGPSHSTECPETEPNHTYGCSVPEEEECLYERPCCDNPNLRTTPYMDNDGLLAKCVEGKWELINQGCNRTPCRDSDTHKCVVGMMEGTNQDEGIMFDIEASSRIRIKDIYQSLGDPGPHVYSVFTTKNKVSFHDVFDRPDAWDLVGSSLVNFPEELAPFIHHPLNLDLDIVLNPGDIQGVYITGFFGDVLFTPCGGSKTSITAQNADLKILYGPLVNIDDGLFATEADMEFLIPWDGMLCYESVRDDDESSESSRVTGDRGGHGTDESPDIP